MYEIEYFKSSNPDFDVSTWLSLLEKRAETDKDAGIQYRQVHHAMRILRSMGTKAPEKNVKHLDDGIWELRPGCNRILLFHYRDGKFILLHHFRKTTRKTPPAEIARAKDERATYLRQQGGKSK